MAGICGYGQHDLCVIPTDDCGLYILQYYKALTLVLPEPRASYCHLRPNGNRRRGDGSDRRSLGTAHLTY